MPLCNPILSRISTVLLTTTYSEFPQELSGHVVDSGRSDGFEGVGRWTAREEIAPAGVRNAPPAHSFFHANLYNISISCSFKRCNPKAEGGGGAP